MDEAYIGAPEKGGKRGRGTTKTPVLAALSLDALDHPQHARLEAATRFRRGSAEFRRWRRRTRLKQSLT
jgi:hypothetical protein